MTNAEIILSICVKALNEGKLTGSAKQFIEDIQYYDKKDLRKLSKKQYQFLIDICNKNS